MCIIREENKDESIQISWPCKRWHNKNHANDLWCLHQIIEISNKKTTFHTSDYFFVFVFVVWRIEPRTLCMQDENSTTEPHPQPNFEGLCMLFIQCRTPRGVSHCALALSKGLQRLLEILEMQHLSDFLLSPGSTEFPLWGWQAAFLNLEPEWALRACLGSIHFWAWPAPILCAQCSGQGLPPKAVESFYLGSWVNTGSWGPGVLQAMVTASFHRWFEYTVVFEESKGSWEAEMKLFRLGSW